MRNVFLHNRRKGVIIGAKTENTRRIEYVKITEGNCEYAASACNPVSRRTGDSAVCRHHDTCLRRDGKYQHFPRRCHVRKEDRYVIGCDGDKILVDDNSGKYIYTIQSLDTAAGTASVKNVISGDTTEITVRATVSKVIITIPVIGFLSMAAQSREGIMIIGLAILFLVILFILSEVWKRDEEEDEEEEEEDEDEDDEKASEELRSRKKAALEEKRNGKNRK